MKPKKEGPEADPQDNYEFSSRQVLGSDYMSPPRQASHDKKSAIWKVKSWFFLVIILVIISGAIFFLSRVLDSGVSKGVDDDGWQAVFLTNNQVYFGKLLETGERYILSNIYYLQVDQPLQLAQDNLSQQIENQPDIRLIKLGNELHGPKDIMYIERANVLFWENIKEDSQIVETIKNYEKQNR